MSIKEKIVMQAQDKALVYLHKEGIFYKAYNEGAYMLDFLGYKVSAKFVKDCNQMVYSIGFPPAVLDKLAENYTIANQNNIKMLSTKAIFEPENYELWCKQNSITVRAIDFKEQLLNYQLANATPIEAYIWLYNLQNKLRANG